MEQAMIIATLLAKYGPGLAQAVAEIFTLPDPSKADWSKVWALAETPFDTLVPKKS